MLSYFHFLLLPFNQKEQYLQDNGTFLLTQTHSKGKVGLYAVSNFFVEVHRDQDNVVTTIAAFKNLDRLSYHTEHIKLSQFLV